MEHESNRMATPIARNKGGRPPDAVIKARAPAVPVTEVEIVLPPVIGIRCEHCGRGMVPRIKRTEPTRRTVTCTLCGKDMAITYSAETPKGMIQKL